MPVTADVATGRGRIGLLPFLAVDRHSSSSFGLVVPRLCRHVIPRDGERRHGASVRDRFVCRRCWFN